jgi:partitioning defective protein 3
MQNNRLGSMKTSRQKSDLRSEAMDRVGELGPSLGMKKSSSLESLQTMVQEIQMSDEPRGPNALRAPRGRGREEILRAAVERPEARKHWLLEDGDNEGGFGNRGTLQASAGSKDKSKNQKKPGLLKGIGSMFRFGKHRKDVYPAPQTEVITDYSSWSNDTSKSATLGPSVASPSASNQSKISQREQREASHERQLSGSNGPPVYHPPPANGHANSKIAQNDAFNHRYSHYVNYDELQMQIR